MVVLLFRLLMKPAGVLRVEREAAYISIVFPVLSITAMGFVGSTIHDAIDGPFRRIAGVGASGAFLIAVDADRGVKDLRTVEEEFRRKSDCGRVTVLGGKTSSSVVSPSSAVI